MHCHRRDGCAGCGRSGQKRKNEPENKRRDIRGTRSWSKAKSLGMLLSALDIVLAEGSSSAVPEWFVDDGHTRLSGRVRHGLIPFLIFGHFSRLQVIVSKGIFLL